jgi:glycosyltransferase involved in cell wall biosynthesis
MEPIVSILVPVYNVEPYLRQAIDSILAQTFTDFELILINDGSTDRSGEIIDSYRARDSRIVAVHKENEGVARTLNRGLAMARGKYIRRFDSDDTCLPTALEHQIEFLEQHPDVALVGTQIAFQSASGKIAWNFRNPHNKYFQNRDYRIVDASEFFDGCPIIHATVLIRTEIIKHLGGYRTEFLTSEDIDLWLRIIEVYPAAALNECSYFVRLHQTSATRRHKSSGSFYRELALKFHEERIAIGSDLLQRGESMPHPPAFTQNYAPSADPDGRTFRDDLDFIYRLMVDARDWRNISLLGRQALSSGWRRSETYKLLIFPFMGERLVQLGVSLKRLLKTTWL